MSFRVAGLKLERNHGLHDGKQTQVIYVRGFRKRSQKLVKTATKTC